MYGKNTISIPHLPYTAPKNASYYETNHSFIIGWLPAGIS